MHFGLTNAPATFQHLRNSIFHPHLGRFIVIYLDDIFLLSKTWDEHQQHVHLVPEMRRTQKLQV